MRADMQHGRRVARRGCIGKVRRPLAALQGACGDGLAGCRGRQVRRVCLVHLQVVLPENNKLQEYYKHAPKQEEFATF